MERFWREHSGTTVNDMMLDTSAELLDAQERPEVLSRLPPIEGKRVLEIGAGIGRFTGHVARLASSVKAVDFMEKLIMQNKATHEKLFPHVSFVCADATKMVEADGAYDFVFTNWLLMYLSDVEVDRFARRSLRWTSPGGHIFFRESCFRQSGDKARAFNPTKYRTPEQYVAAFSRPQEGGYRWECESHGRIETYVKLKKNEGQLYWIWRKVPCDEAGAEAVEETAPADIAAAAAERS